MAIFNVFGSYRFAASSGLTTGVAAATDTAGHLLASRWGNTVFQQRITSIEAAFLVTTGFTAAQRVGYDIVIARTYSASHTGATAITLTTNNAKLRQNTDTTRLTDARIADTGALTAGTHTFDATLLATDSVAALAATAGLKVRNVHDFTASELGGLVLEANEGVVARNLVALGAAGVVQWYFAISWDEGQVF